MRDHTLTFDHKNTTHTILKISDSPRREKQNDSKCSSVLFQMIVCTSFECNYNFCLHLQHQIREKTSQTQIVLASGNLKLQRWEHGLPNSASHQTLTLCFENGSEFGHFLMIKWQVIFPLSYWYLVKEVVYIILSSDEKINSLPQNQNWHQILIGSLQAIRKFTDDRISN